MGRPPGSRSTQPVFPSGVPKETASRSRLAAGRFTFIAVLKSIRSAALAGPSAALLRAFGAVFTSCRESGVSRAETPRSRLMLVQSDSVHTLGEDMETSTAQRIYQLRSRLEVERRGPKILQEEFPMRGLRRTGISGPPESSHRKFFLQDFRPSAFYLQARPQLINALRRGGFHVFPKCVDAVALHQH